MLWIQRQATRWNIPGARKRRAGLCLGILALTSLAGQGGASLSLSDSRPRVRDGRKDSSPSPRGDAGGKGRTTHHRLCVPDAARDLSQRLFRVWVNLPDPPAARPWQQE